ncbi:hypothetical protein CAPTEDRAFT_74551, partial [Capitella teleta]
GCTGLTGNLFVVCIMLSSRNLRKSTTTTYLINQSVIDGLASLFLVLQMLFKSRSQVFDSLLDEIYCRVWLSRAFLWSFFATSSSNLMVITLERLVATWKPLWHRTSVTRPKQLLSILIIWTPGTVITLAHSTKAAGVVNGRCRAYGIGGTFTDVTGYICIIFEYVLPLAVFIFGYGKIAWILHSKPANLKSTGETRSKSIHVIKVLLILTTCFLVCWTPNAVYYFLQLTGHVPNLRSPVYKFSVLAVNFNCCCNPFVYLIKYKDFQRAVRKTFCRSRVA